MARADVLSFLTNIFAPNCAIILGHSICYNYVQKYLKVVKTISENIVMFMYVSYKNIINNKNNLEGPKIVSSVLVGAAHCIFTEGTVSRVFGFTNVCAIVLPGYNSIIL